MSEHATSDRSAAAPTSAGADESSAPLQEGDHAAVVIGAGMAGLLVASVLSRRLRGSGTGAAAGTVLVVDRDELPTDASPRRGVPQGRQLHALLATGASALEDLLPGLTDELVAAGVPRGDGQRDVTWYLDGHRLHEGHAHLPGFSMTRPALELAVRARVAALPGVRILDRHDVTGLTATPDRATVTGVTVRPRGGGAEREVPAGLVVDASGRGHATSAWLGALGYDAPAETSVRSDVVYVTRHYTVPPSLAPERLGTAMLPWPDLPRSGVSVRQEGDRMVVLLAGLMGERPPTDDAGMLAFARSLPGPEIAAVIEEGEPLDEAVTMRYPVSSRRHYERLSRLPAHHLVIGDGLCSFNPVYGQGMSVAAMEVQLLDRMLAKGLGDDLPRRFYRRAASLLQRPWALAVGGDLRFPQVEGARPPGSALLERYLDRFRGAASRDEVLGTAFIRVVNMVRGPGHLLRPDLAWRVLRAGRTAPVVLPDRDAASVTLPETAPASISLPETEPAPSRRAPV